jgi:hypothetical protein
VCARCCDGGAVGAQALGICGAGIGLGACLIKKVVSRYELEYYDGGIVALLVLVLGDSVVWDTLCRQGLRWSVYCSGGALVHDVWR